MKEPGDRFVELAAEIGGRDARAASTMVRFFYRFLSPYSAEMISQRLKRARTGLTGAMGGVIARRRRGSGKALPE